MEWAWEKQTAYAISFSTFWQLLTSELNELLTDSTIMKFKSTLFIHLFNEHPLSTYYVLE